MLGAGEDQRAIDIFAGDDRVEQRLLFLLFDESRILADLFDGRRRRRHRHRHRILEELFGKRSEEHTSELQSLMRISYAVFCLKKKKTKHHTHNHYTSSKLK